VDVVEEEDEAVNEGRRMSWRWASYQALAAFVQPGGLSFGARGFLPFGAPSPAIFFGGMVVEEKRRSCNYEGIRRGK
jgi:hypothetical protein